MIRAVLFLAVALAFGGCAVESPRLYVAIPHTPVKAYVYGGAGLVVDPDPPASGN